MLADGDAEDPGSSQRGQNILCSPSSLSGPTKNSLNASLTVSALYRCATLSPSQIEGRRDGGSERRIGFRLLYRVRVS